VSVAGKTVLVTGAGANIGRAIAELFARQGARVAITTRSNAGGGENAAESIRSQGGEALFFGADLTDEAQVDRLFSYVEENFGPVEVLINNAGAALPTPFLDSEVSRWRDVFEINFFTALNCSRRAAPKMLEKGEGSIINTVSVRGFDHTGREGIMAYSAAKAALTNFTKTLAKELAPGISVNAVSPGFVLTSAYDKASEEVKKGFIESTMIKRWIQPEELAEAYLYLAGQSAITGTVLSVDGGFLLKQA
jgi:3-oxoacyl-[acyl-carrier protein] reductase